MILVATDWMEGRKLVESWQTGWWALFQKTRIEKRESQGVRWLSG